MTDHRTIDGMIHRRVSDVAGSKSLDRILPEGRAGRARAFHRQIPGFRPSPLLGLPHLAAHLGVAGLWVKNEAERLGLGSFKVLGASHGIVRWLEQRLGTAPSTLTYDDLISPAVRERLGDVTLATATDGNHGRGVAWAARTLGLRAVIYVHSTTAPARIRAIEEQGAQVEIVTGTYDDAVRQLERDAGDQGWQIISDTSWEGYEEIPTWIMQGYSTLLEETLEQLAEHGQGVPTHYLIQGGVGALAAATIGFFRRAQTSGGPTCVVVEPTEAACLLGSARRGDGRPHTFDGDLDTIVAGLSCGEPSPLAWDLLHDHADAFVAVPDYVAATGMRTLAAPLAGDPAITSGESGAVTLGALMVLLQTADAAELREALALGPDSQVLLINTEGDTDPVHYRKVVWDGACPIPDSVSWSP